MKNTEYPGVFCHLPRTKASTAWSGRLGCGCDGRTALRGRRAGGTAVLTHSLPPTTAPEMVCWRGDGVEVWRQRPVRSSSPHCRRSWRSHRNRRARGWELACLAGCGGRPNCCQLTWRVAPRVIRPPRNRPRSVASAADPSCLSWPRRGHRCGPLGCGRGTWPFRGGWAHLRRHLKRTLAAANPVTPSNASDVSWLRPVEC